MTHAILPISFKLSQFVGVTKLFKNTEWLGLPAHPWDVKAPTINPWGKRLKQLEKCTLSHTNKMRWTLINYKLQVINETQLSVTKRHLLSGVNLDIPLVSRKLNIIETMNTDLLKH